MSLRTEGEASGAADAERDAFAAMDRARRARHRGILVWIVVGCLILAAAGFAFVRWLMSQPPGTISR